VSSPLAPDEHVVVRSRRHLVVALMPGWAPILGLFVLGWLHRRVPAGNAVLTLADLAEVVLIGRWIWLAIEWRYAAFTVTNRRVMLDYGVLSRRRAMMPIAKVTDLTYARSPLGDLLGYGHVIIESAGQDQALHKISFVPQPDVVFGEMDAVLFGARRSNASHTARRRTH
jgi:uncharacterized membrane protein YdbT with pleckstrin-like domain